MADKIKYLGQEGLDILIDNIKKEMSTISEALGPVQHIEVVTALPEDASSHPNTLYLVKG